MVSQLFFNFLGFENLLASISSWELFRFLSEPLLGLLRYIDGVIENFGYGYGIVITTLMIRLVVLGLGYLNSVPKKIDPAAIENFENKTKLIEKVHHDNPNLVKHRVKKLKESMLSPKPKFPAAGWMIAVLGLLFFFSLYNVVLRSDEINGASFLLGIDDLSAKLPNSQLALFAIVVSDINYLMSVFLGKKFNHHNQLKPLLVVIFFIALPISILSYFVIMDLPAGIVLYFAVLSVVSLIVSRFTTSPNHF